MPLSDIWDSAKDYVKSKFTNPFFGTFIVVWLIINWRLWFGIFTFDDDETQTYKLQYVADYYEGKSVLWGISKTVLLTFVALIFSYLLLFAARLLSNTYEDWLLPGAYKWAAKGKTVLRERWLESEKEVRAKQDELDKERELRLKAEATRDKLISTTSEDVTNLKNIIEKLQIEKVKDGEMITSFTNSLINEAKEKIAGKPVPESNNAKPANAENSEGDILEVIDLGNVSKVGDVVLDSDQFLELVKRKIDKTILSQLDQSDIGIFARVFARVAYNQRYIDQLKNLVEAIKEQNKVYENNTLISGIAPILIDNGLIIFTDKIGPQKIGRYKWKGARGEGFFQLMSSLIEGKERVLDLNVHAKEDPN